MFGYFLSPLFSATIMDTFDDKLKGMKWGFRLNQFISVLGVILLIILIKIMRKRNFREKKNESNIEVFIIFEKKIFFLHFYIFLSTLAFELFDEQDLNCFISNCVNILNLNLKFLEMNEYFMNLNTFYL